MNARTGGVLRDTACFHDIDDMTILGEEVAALIGAAAVLTDDDCIATMMGAASERVARILEILRGMEGCP